MMHVFISWIIMNHDLLQHSKFMLRYCRYLDTVQPVGLVCSDARRKRRNCWQRFLDERAIPDTLHFLCRSLKWFATSLTPNLLSKTRASLAAWAGQWSWEFDNFVGFLLAVNGVHWPWTMTVSSILSSSIDRSLQNTIGEYYRRF